MCRKMEASVWDAEEEMFQEGQTFAEPQRDKNPYIKWALIQVHRIIFSPLVRPKSLFYLDLAWF
jgi:hypothetical protein